MFQPTHRCVAPDGRTIELQVLRRGHEVDYRVTIDGETDMFYQNSDGAACVRRFDELTFGSDAPTHKVSPTHYRVQWRRTDADDIRMSTVAITAGYTTFEAIRTILAVKETGRQTPELIDVLTVTKLEENA
jgi:hypothetical protein